MKIEFYHTFILPDGRRFEGQWDLNPTVSKLEQINVAGKTVLDVACRDGWYSYHFEKRGAKKVFGMDIDDRQARRFTHDAFKSSVWFMHRNAYSLKEANEKSFDVVFAGDILCHVDNPLGLLKRIHHVTKERFYLVADVFPQMDTWDKFYIWKFTEKALLDLLGMAGFRDIQILSRYAMSGTFWKHAGGQPLVRDIALFSCARDPDWKMDLLEDEIIPVEKSINYRPELTYEVEAC